MALQKYLGAIFSTAGKIILGLLTLGSLGLILGQTLGIVIIFAFLFYNFLKNKQNFAYFSFLTIKKMIYKYKNFPLYNIPSSVINAFAANLHIILFLKFYGPQITGIMLLHHINFCSISSYFAVIFTVFIIRKYQITKIASSFFNV